MKRLHTGVMVMVALLVASCATKRGGEVYLFRGPDKVLEQFLDASKACGYSHIDKTLGGHLETIVVLDIPAPRTAEFDCALSWAKTHGLVSRN